MLEYGKIIFLTKLEISTEMELVLRVEDYNPNDKTISSTKVLMFKKEIKPDNLELIPIKNMFIVSSMNGTENNKNEASIMTFNLNNFDVYGEVNSQEILNLFNETFSNDEDKKILSVKQKKSKKVLLGSQVNNE